MENKKNITRAQNSAFRRNVRKRVLVARHSPAREILSEPSAFDPARRAALDASVEMDLTGKHMPDFHVKTFGADGAIARLPVSSLVQGTPAIIDFYNSG